MASNDYSPHFILIPLMAQGHQIPMVDIAKLLASHEVTVTLVTTPQNSARFDSTIHRAVETGLDIRLLRLRFPSTEAGLPEKCESLDSIPSRDLSINFLRATTMLKPELEQFLSGAQPKPSCIISDRYLPWTLGVARQFRVPRLIFDGMSCFNLVCTNNIMASRIGEKISGPDEPFLVPDLSHEIELTKEQLPERLNPGPLFSKELHDEIDEADEASFGLVINTFENLEKEYLREARKLFGGKVWAIGPLSLCNRDKFDMFHRGNKSTVDEDKIMKWLDTWPPRSVVYVCLGTLSILKPRQRVELALALEASQRPFLWVISGGGSDLEIAGCGGERGLVIFGWAPQVLILSHGAVGGFLTHCGWNSTMEGACAGVPMVTWPMFSDQFFNERSVTRVLGVGVGVGVVRGVRWGQELSDDDSDGGGVGLLKSEEIVSAVEKVMGVGEEQEGRRRRARQIREMAYKAMEINGGCGSSHSNVSMMIQEVAQQFQRLQYQ